MSCVVYGRPQGKGRPRYTVRGGRAVAYTPEGTRRYEAQIAQAWQEQDGRDFGTAALALVIKAYYPVPSRAKKAEREAMLAGQIPVTDKPDLDNVLKVCADSLNGIAYEDDRQVTYISACRMYSEAPRVEIDLILIK